MLDLPSTAVTVRGEPSRARPRRIVTPASRSSFS
jgi:hypothetical protein